MGTTVQAVTVHFNSHWNRCTALHYTILQFSWPFAPHLVNLLPIYISLINAIAPSTGGKPSNILAPQRSYSFVSWASCIVNDKSCTKDYNSGFTPIILSPVLTSATAFSHSDQSLLDFLVMANCWTTSPHQTSVMRMQTQLWFPVTMSFELSSSVSVPGQHSSHHFHHCWVNSPRFSSVRPEFHVMHWPFLNQVETCEGRHFFGKFPYTWVSRKSPEDKL